MPIYEYQCQACEHVFDVLQKMSDEPLTYCPECGEPKLRKLLSAPNFRLKGGGWYETDFKDKNKRNLAGTADTGSGSTAAASTAGGADAKGADSGAPAAKSSDTKSSDAKSSDTKSSGARDSKSATKSADG